MNDRRPPAYRNPPHGNDLRDPRFGRDGYSPEVQGDIETQQWVADHARDIPDVADIYDRLQAKQRPVQLSYVMHVARLGKVNDQQLLIPKNPRRQALIISNYGPPADFANTGSLGAVGVIFSYDKPQKFDAPAPFGGALFAGIPLDPQSYFIENNGAVSINDIWVASNLVNGVAGNYPIYIVAFEGQLSISGNQR